jgi:hypothetical protein
MPQKSFFVVSNSDGEIEIEICSETDLLKWINEQHWGDDVTFMGTSDFQNQRVGHNHWPHENGILILRGEIVIPTPVVEVVRFKIDPEKP